MTTLGHSASARAEDKARCETVEPPDFLKEKLIKGQGIDAAEAERRALAAVATMQEDYLRQAHKDLGRADRALAKVRLSSGPALAEALDEVLWIAHEMRGQAGTFGYGLVTTIGTEICRYIEAAETPEAVRHDALLVYVDAMRAVIGGRVLGDGGEVGEQILASMYARAAKGGGPGSA